MEQSKLDNLLKKIEENRNCKEGSEKIPVALPDAGETLEMRLMTFQERKDFQFSIVNNANGGVNIKDTLTSENIKKIIYNVCGLKDLAVQAKERKLINKYYDVVDFLFSAEDMSIVFMALLDANRMVDNKEVEEVKN